MVKYFGKCKPIPLFIAFLLLTSCNSGDNQQELTPVTVGITSFIGEAASFVAEEKGFFRENGLDVTLQVNSAGSESVRQLLSGDVDIAHIAETSLLYSLLDSSYFTGQKQGDIQVVANMILANQIQKIIGRRDSGIENPRDIKGKKVALAGGTQSEYHLDSFLLEYQINMNEIDTVHMSVQKQVEAIKNGKIDVAVAWEPQASQIEHQLGENAAVLPTRLTYSTLWLAAVLDHYAAKNPEVIMAYLKSLRQAQKYILNNPEQVLTLLAERTGVSFEIIHQAVSQIDFALNLSERMINLLQEQQRWMIESELTDRDGMNVLDLIEFRFMEEVYPDGISLIR